MVEIKTRMFMEKMQRGDVERIRSSVRRDESEDQNSI